MKHVDFFKECHFELLKAYVTRDSKDINRLCIKFRRGVYGYALTLSNNYYFTSVDVDDFIQEALIALIRYLPEYRFICPNCSSRFVSFADYRMHSKRENGSLVAPSKSIRKYLSYIIRDRLVKFKEKQLCKKRDPRIFISDGSIEANNGIDDLYFDLGNPEKVAISNFKIIRIKEYLSKERDYKIREFIQCILKGYTPREAYSNMVENLYFLSCDSAYCCIRSLKKRKSFLKYRDLLVE